MPSATVSGALLGLAFYYFDVRATNRIVAMGVGMVLANAIAKWDNDAQQRKRPKLIPMPPPKIGNDDSEELKTVFMPHSSHDFGVRKFDEKKMKFSETVEKEI